MLEPGLYTAVVEGVASESGVILLEVYDLSAKGESDNLLNISTRALVGTGNAVCVAGFVIEGTLPRRVLLRGFGPGLRKFGLVDALADSEIKRFSGETEVAHNDDWQVNQASVEDASTKVGAFALEVESKDAAMVISLNPGVYSVHLLGVGGASGVGLIEVYEVR